jgi:hypothetical protein
VNSDARYAGNSAGGNNAIQLRSKNSNSGIVTTASGGKVTKVKVAWNSNTGSDRKLDVYGYTSAYSDASDLYGTSKGTKIGSIAMGTTELAVDGNYTYVGVRSNNGALYMDEITFTWQTAAGGSSTTYYSAECECTATGIVEVEGQDSKVEGTKVLIDGQLYIMYNGKMYNVLGMMK